MTLPELVLVLLVWINAHTWYALPDTPPVVQRLTLSELQSKFCPDVACELFGLYVALPDERTYVYMRNDLDLLGDPWHQSALVHELVHYVQHLSGRWAPPYDCPSWVAQEREAYWIQARWLWSKGIRNSVMRSAPQNDICTGLRWPDG